uniref:SWIM-type domain-containing protein n=1 Tax=Lactuca sativa TaxID=4236 RepID=A0A9R1XGF6_LACSA|nr:hypothetical protein LSAT_V11C400197610 [Lactuca sativa]
MLKEKIARQTVLLTRTGYLDGKIFGLSHNYASLGGFDVRLGPFRTTESGITTQRHLLCNREGKPTTGKVDTLDPQQNKIRRRKYSFRCECKAKIVVILLHGTNKYNVVEFVDQHNHMLFGKDNMFLSHTKRKLDYSQEMFIHNLSKQNIGASRAHRLYSILQGGSDIRGGLVSDFKNSTRNLNAYIGARDAKFLVLKMLEKKTISQVFFFDFRVVEKKLNSIFWADETANYNYNAFGDVSLDATFSMNKYDMVFIPFTGIDNHKNCVTFGVGLLIREDASSYSWLLRAFLKSFKKQPTPVLTYQDPTLNKAVNEITSQLATNSAFRKRFHSIIWNSKLEPHDFKKEWKSFLNEFNISTNKWLQEMYGLCRRLVPAFFKEIPMFGIMRTTSFSEGQNWSFQNNTLTGSYLLMFMMTFEGVMERQRRNQVVNDFNIATTLPRFITSSPIEAHASKVTHSTTDDSYKCTCMHFEHVGILCRHIFCVFKFYSIEQIPEEYIMKRWCRMLFQQNCLKCIFLILY